MDIKTALTSMVFVAIIIVTLNLILAFLFMIFIEVRKNIKLRRVDNMSEYTTTRIKVSFYLDVKHEKEASMKEIVSEIRKDIKDDLCGSSSCDYSWKEVDRLSVLPCKEE